MRADNFAALREFRDLWRPFADERMRELQRFVIDAEVTYHSSILNAGEITTVTINCQAGPDDGSISIEEVGCLNLKVVHLDFRADFQEFEFRRDTGALVISGSSPKMKGRYEVSVQPTGSFEDDDAQD